MCNRDAHRWGTRSVLTVSSFLFSSFTFSKRNIFDRNGRNVTIVRCLCVIFF